MGCLLRANSLGDPGREVGRGLSNPLRSSTQVLCPAAVKKLCVQGKHNCAGRAVEKQAPTQLVVALRGLPLRRTTWQHLSKLKMHMAFDPAAPLPSIFPVDTLPHVPSDAWTRIFVCIIVYNNKGLETAPTLSSGGGRLAKLSWEEWLTFIECLLHTLDKYYLI